MGIGEDIVKAELNFMDGWSDGYYSREPADESNPYMEGYRTGEDDRQREDDGLSPGLSQSW